MPTQTYISDNRSNGYDRLNTAQVRSSMVAEKPIKEVLKACHDLDDATYHF
jgi:hypothetical protein